MAPEIEISTERLLLRPLKISDAEVFYKYKSDKTANQYQGWIPNKIEDAYDFIHNRISSKIDVVETWYQLAIINKDTNELIGDIGIHFLDAEKKQVALGYTLNKSFQGKGYASEALMAMINFLFNQLNKRRIIASIDPRNKASIRLIERLGFRKEAHFKECILQNGEWLDDLVYAILKDEWFESFQ